MLLEEFFNRDAEENIIRDFLGATMKMKRYRWNTPSAEEAPRRITFGVRGADDIYDRWRRR